MAWIRRVWPTKVQSVAAIWTMRPSDCVCFPAHLCAHLHRKNWMWCSVCRRWAVHRTLCPCWLARIPCTCPCIRRVCCRATAALLRCSPNLCDHRSGSSADARKWIEYISAGATCDSRSGSSRQRRRICWANRCTDISAGATVRSGRSLSTNCVRWKWSSASSTSLKWIIFYLPVIRLCLETFSAAICWSGKCHRWMDHHARISHQTILKLTIWMD